MRHYYRFIQTAGPPEKTQLPFRVFEMECLSCGSYRMVDRNHPGTYERCPKCGKLTKVAHIGNALKASPEWERFGGITFAYGGKTRG
jgi:hypothetical protein